MKLYDYSKDRVIISFDINPPPLVEDPDKFYQSNEKKWFCNIRVRSQRRGELSTCHLIPLWKRGIEGDFYSGCAGDRSLRTVTLKIPLPPFRKGGKSGPGYSHYA